MHKTVNKYHFFFSRFTKFLLLVICALSVLGVCAAIISILFSRPIGDDYGSIATFHYTDNWLSEAYKSLVTTGRYSQSIAATALYGLLGNKIVTILPLLVLFWFLVIMYLYGKNILGRYLRDDLHLRLFAMIIAFILTFLVLFINNSPATNNLPAWVSFQLFFWSSGIITYTLPFLLLVTVFYLLFLSSFKNRLNQRFQFIGFIAVILISSLFNEIQPAIIIASSAGLLVLSYTPYYKSLRKHRKLITGAFVTGAISMLALYFSPGRLSRSQFLATIEPSVKGSLVESVIRNINTLFHGLYFRPREIILLILIGFVFAFITYLFTDKKKFAKGIKDLAPYAPLTSLICALSIIISIILVVIGYGYTAGIYPRTMLIAQFLYVLSIPLLAFATIGFILIKYKQWVEYALAGLMIVLGIIFIASLPNYIGKILVQVNSSVAYANAWDAQDKTLRDAASDNKKEEVFIDKPATGLGDGFSLTCTGPYAKSTMWLNVQVWEYYGKKEVRICERPPVERPTQ